MNQRKAVEGLLLCGLCGKHGVYDTTRPFKIPSSGELNRVLCGYAAAYVEAYNAAMRFLCSAYPGAYAKASAAAAAHAAKGGFPAYEPTKSQLGGHLVSWRDMAKELTGWRASGAVSRSAPTGVQRAALMDARNAYLAK